MTEEQRKAIDELRHAGYAVIVWTPEEVGTANPRKVEDRSIELGWDVINDLGSDETMSCHECGGAMRIDSSGVSNHLDDNGNIDHDTDANHVAVADEGVKLSGDDWKRNLQVGDEVTVPDPENPNGWVITIRQIEYKGDIVRIVDNFGGDAEYKIDELS